jgi:hypothetical protein
MQDDISDTLTHAVMKIGQARFLYRLIGIPPHTITTQLVRSHTKPLGDTTQGPGQNDSGLPRQETIHNGVRHANPVGKARRRQEDDELHDEARPLFLLKSCGSDRRYGVDMKGKERIHRLEQTSKTSF